MGNEPTASTTAARSGESLPHPVAAENPQQILTVQRSWIVASVIAGIMVLLALLGVALTTTGRSAAPPYWISLAPIFGVLCVGTAWARQRHGVGLGHAEVIRQIFHWLGVAMALGLDFMVRGTGEETGHAAGLNAMLLLALGCFLAGVHLEWHFSIVGLLLGLALLVVAKAEEYVWLVFIVGALAAAGLFSVRWLFLHGRSAKRVSVAHPSGPAGS